MGGVLTALAGVLPSAGGPPPSNWWEAGGATGCVAAYDAKTAASYAASKVNLANPGTHDLTDGDAPTWANGTGWTFDGAADYLIAPGVNPQDDWTVLCQFTSGLALGVYHGASDRWGISNPGGGNVVIFHNGEFYVGAPSAASNDGIAGLEAFRDGVSLDVIPVGYSNAAYDCYIGAVNVGGSLALFFEDGVIESIAFYNNTLDGSEMLAVATAMAAL